MNKWIGMGRLTQDPELKKTSNGVSVCSFTIAINRQFNKEETDFINCVAWRQTADFVSKYFTKGKMIAAEGTIQVRKWENDNGDKRYVTEAIIDNVEFCGDGTKDSSSDKKQENKIVKTKTQPKAEPEYEETEDDDDLPF